MKIIQIDNFARDNISDQLITDKINDEESGKKMVETLNIRYSGSVSPIFFQLQKDDYKLYEFEY